MRVMAGMQFGALVRCYFADLTAGATGLGASGGAAY